MKESDGFPPLRTYSPCSESLKRCVEQPHFVRLHLPKLNFSLQSYLPFNHNTSRVSGEKTSLVTLHTTDKCTDAKRTTSTSLCISATYSTLRNVQLLLTTNIVCYVLYWRHFVKRHTIALSFYTCLPWKAHNMSTISTSFLASALNPVKRKVMFSSTFSSFFTVRGSWSWAVVFFSIPRTMHLSHTAAATEYPYSINHEQKKNLSHSFHSILYLKEMTIGWEDC